VTVTVSRRPFDQLNPTDGFTPVVLSRSDSTDLAYFHPSTRVLIAPQAARPNASATTAANRYPASVVMSVTLGWRAVDYNRRTKAALCPSEESELVCKPMRNAVRLRFEKNRMPAAQSAGRSQGGSR